jgi:hypothetical protein
MKRGLLGLAAVVVLAAGAAAQAEENTDRGSRLNVAPAVYQHQGQAPVEEVRWRGRSYGWHGRPYGRYYSYRPYYGYGYSPYRYSYRYSYPYSYRYRYSYGYPGYGYGYGYPRYGWYGSPYRGFSIGFRF